MMTGESPGFARGTAFFTLNCLISTPCGPSAERTTRRTRSPSITSIVAGSKAKRFATTSNVFGSAAGSCRRADVEPNAVKASRRVATVAANVDAGGTSVETEFSNTYTTDALSEMPEIHTEFSLSAHDAVYAERKRLRRMLRISSKTPDAVQIA